MALEHENGVYQSHLIDLLAYEGKYILIRGDDLAGPWNSYEEALQEGFDRFGPVSFLVKKIQKVDPIQYFSRDLPPCRS
jgi:hypothetical protein